jgi:hypothetical protein
MKNASEKGPIKSSNQSLTEQLMTHGSRPSRLKPLDN